MATPLTLEELEDMHDKLKGCFKAASNRYYWAGNYDEISAFTNAATALLAIDQRLVEMTAKPQSIKKSIG